MPSRPTSRIEVDLKLLEDRNIDRLQEFGKQFDASISRLADSLKQEAENLQGMADQRAGQLSQHASTGANIGTPPPAHARMGGQNTGGFGGGNYNLGGPGGGGPSVATPPPPAPSPIDNSRFEEEYARATKRLGERVPVGFRQTLGYAAEGAIQIPGLSRETARKWNDKLFQMESYSQNVRLALGHMNSVFASIAGPTQLGQQLGASREGGLFGTGLFSPAFNRGFMENIHAAMAADFGFNPNYSMAQARAARQATQSMGYSGHMADVINEQMKQLQIHQQIDPGTVMEMLDPLLRFGNPQQNSQQLIDVLRAIPDAAKAASFNLKTFTEQLTSTSSEIAQQTGMKQGQVVSALSSFSAATGLAPSRAAGLFTSNNLTLAAAMTGKTMTQLVENPSAAPEMAFGLNLFHSMTGMTGKQLLQLRKTNRGEYNRAMDGVYRLYEQNKDIFGGFSPLELINMSVRNNGKTRQHIAARQQIQDLSLGSGSVDRIQGIMNFYGEGEGGAFSKWRQDYLQKHAVTSAQDLTKFRQAAQDQALNMLSTHQQKQGQKAAVQITLSPDAKKWFDLMTKSTAQTDTSNRNAMEHFWRTAKTVGNDALQVGEFLHPELGAGKKALEVLGNIF